jgi:hypothetical protein
VLGRKESMNGSRKGDRRQQEVALHRRLTR